MKSSSARAAAKRAIVWLRWAVVLALVCSAWGELVYIALRPDGHVSRPVPLAVVQNLIFVLTFALKDTAFVVAGAKIAPRFRRTTAVVLAAVHVPLSLWNQVLSRVSLVDFVLLQGSGDYIHFGLEALGSVLGVVYIFWSEKRINPKTTTPVALPSPPGRGVGGEGRGLETAIRWLRWAAVLALVSSELSALVDSALAGFVFSALGQEAATHRPVSLAIVHILRVHVLRGIVFIVAGALIAPRFRLVVAIVLAAAQVSFSFWAHVLAAGGPWWSWTINYTHFSLETLGPALGVVYIYWLESRVRIAARRLDQIEQTA